MASRRILDCFIDPESHRRNAAIIEVVHWVTHRYPRTRRRKLQEQKYGFLEELDGTAVMETLYVLLITMNGAVRCPMTRELESSLTSAQLSLCP